MKFLVGLVMVFGFLSFNSALACGEHEANSGKLQTRMTAQTENVKLALARVCHDELDCSPGSQCLNGQCVFGGKCTSDVDCGPGRKCSSGVCH